MGATVSCLFHWQMCINRPPRGFLKSPGPLLLEHLQWAPASTSFFGKKGGWGHQGININSGILGKKTFQVGSFTFDINLGCMRHPVNLVSRAIRSRKNKEITQTCFTSWSRLGVCVRTGSEEVFLLLRFSIQGSGWRNPQCKSPFFPSSARRKASLFLSL